MIINSNLLTLEKKQLKNIYRSSLKKLRKNNKNNSSCFQDQHQLDQIFKVKKLKKLLIKKRINKKIL